MYDDTDDNYSNSLRIYVLSYYTTLIVSYAHDIRLINEYVTSINQSITTFRAPKSWPES